jgi:hypothetical protein
MYMIDNSIGLQRQMNNSYYRNVILIVLNHQCIKSLMNDSCDLHQHHTPAGPFMTLSWSIVIAKCSSEPRLLIVSTGTPAESSNLQHSGDLEAKTLIHIIRVQRLQINRNQSTCRSQ